MVLFDLINFSKNKPDNNTIGDIKILYESLADQCPQIHKKRLNSLMVATESLLDRNQLSLTQLGRNIQGKVRAKHSIKRIDRLLEYPHLRNDRLDIYRWHAVHLCSVNSVPIVLVDR